MKLERLISMIYMLLNNEILSASALAEKYNVSQRTIYRDIDAICAAGIPVVSYQGVNGGYGIMEQYKMDKSLLGSYDVSALITILHSMSTVFEDERALDTIQRLQTIDRSANSASQGLSMDIGSWRSYNEILRLLRRAITDRHVISFQYISAKNERIYRKVEPLRLMYKFGSWYLYGFCRTRNDYREFRISRMSELSPPPSPLCASTPRSIRTDLSFKSNIHMSGANGITGNHRRCRRGRAARLPRGPGQSDGSIL